ncbi:hypothetical protein DICPUDRAFT_83013 [Dictyostelium purpureum]|uniref:Pseudouridine synthase RsuA/RluA-like domain-containing protein n=1 Tax=Dictyostelium purpureum TaxID=5786 RepID=F0ZYA5_DICPU|nr:uncharacterized protein DICPUDRAFT_83013 [Dictyostelium purpureum]EGC31072.1 hypothetical protein DICPUDRAFT_83013 [Dictyostelium purpureum]|eukprot:XP_003292398.1 hypothetical protein DICPUDRAFT_83013 [Dictyostelium purpureum]
MNKCNSIIKYIRVAQATYIRANGNSTVLSTVMNHFDNKPSEEYIQNLIESGCIYYRQPLSECKTTPPNPNRIFTNIDLAKDSILKVFFYPRPYSMEHVRCEDPSKYIIFENQYFLIVDKPHGLDVGPIVDNYHGNITAIIGDYIEKRDNRKHKLYNPHRIDGPTRGLIVIIKDPDFLKKFNKMIIKNEVSKIYKAFLPKSSNQNIINPGLYRHYMSPDNVLPKVMVNEKLEKYHECLLQVLNVEEKEISIPIDIDEVSLDLLQTPINFEQVGKGDYRKQMKSIPFYVVDINLITGRTHQIRAQFSKMGYPLLGDRLYGGKKILDLDQQNSYSGNKNYRKMNQDLGKMIGLVSHQLSFKCPITGVDYCFTIKENSYNVNKLKL